MYNLESYQVSFCQLDNSTACIRPKSVLRYFDGTYRYVAQRNGALLNDIYWIPDHSVIKPVGRILPTVPVVKTSGASIDKSKLLQKGSKGLEVRTLQTLLKIKADGDFGRNTQNALFTQKGVKQIRLKDWK